MPKGLVLVDWDDKYGPKVSLTYPENLDIDKDDLIQYLVTIQGRKNTSVIQIQDEEKKVLIFGIKSNKSKNYNYAYLVIMFDKDEFVEIDHFKLLLKDIGIRILNKTLKQQKIEFELLVNKVLKNETKKIIFMGYPNAGKTTTRLFFYEKFKENDLLGTSILPTQGFENLSYKLLDMNISLFDTSGQELDRWLNIDDDTLSYSDLIIFFFSIIDWKENKATIIDYLKKLSSVLKDKNCQNTEVVIFCTKIDLINDTMNNFSLEINEACNNLNMRVLFTTIKDGGNNDLILGNQIILSKISYLIETINNLLRPLIEKYSFESQFILDSSKRIIFEFDSNNLFKENYSYIKNLYPKYFSKQKIADFPKIMVFWLDNYNKALICINIQEFHPSISYLFLVSNSLVNIENFRKEYLLLLQNLEWNKNN